MTPAQIRIVRASFSRIEAVLPQLSRQFYERLFAIAPDLRHSFEEDVSAREAAFIKMMGELINLHPRSRLSLPALGAKVATAEPTGLERAHTDIGFEPEHFNWMRIAMIGSLRAEMGRYFTAHVEEAWMAALEVLTYAMQDGEMPVPAGRDRFLDRFRDEDDAGSQSKAKRPHALQEFFQ